MTSARRASASIALALGAIALLVGMLALYAHEALFDNDGFTDRAMEAYADPAVQSWLADEITIGVIENGDPDLISFRPVIAGTTEALLGSRVGTGLVRRAVADLHRTLFTTDGDTVTLSVADVLILVADAIEPNNPEAADRLLEAEANLVQIANREATADIITFGERLGVVGLILPLVGLALLVLAVALWRPRRRGIVVAGLTFAAVGIVIAAGMVVARAVLLLTVDEGPRAVVEAFWDAYMGELVMWGAGMVVAGGVLALAARSALRPVDVRALLRRVGRIVADPPGGEVGQLARALVAAVLAVALLFRPAELLTAAAVTAGVLLLVWGLSELLRLLFPRATADQAAPAATPGGRRGRRLLVGVVATAIVVLVGVAFATTRGADPAPEAAVDACNGHPELCDRPLDRVAFAGTHNAMAAAEVPDWLLANHARWIPSQLDAGYRALLIDTWYGFPTESGDGVVTDLSESSDEPTDEFDEQTRAAAERTRARLTPEIDEDARDLFLCHGFCEVGATPLSEGLAEIRTFLLQHPGEVLMIVVEDHTSAVDTAAAFEEAGFGDLVWTIESGEGLPTPREMIDSGRRVVVMSENDTEGAPPWYHEGFALTQETPFSFDSPEALAAPDSCRPNRGRPDSPLLQLNHWVQRVAPPRPSDAEVVNEKDFLLERARRCQEERGQLPNIVAVDFHEQGDTLAVVDELNGVAPRD